MTPTMPEILRDPCDPRVDLQRFRLYRWEDRRLEWLVPDLFQTITLEEARALAKSLWLPWRDAGRLGQNDGSIGPRAWYRESGFPVKLVSERRHKGACAVYTLGLIDIAPQSLFPWVVLHEMAHMLWPNASACDGHGPCFAAQYAELLAEFGGSGGATLPEIRGSMRGAGLRLANSRGRLT